MKLVFSFDDGRADAFDAFNVLHKHRLKGTFHITTGYIDHTFSKKNFANGYHPLSVDAILQMKEQGAEFSSHGDKHVMDVHDFIDSFNKIKSFGANADPKIGFSIPYSKTTSKELDFFCNELKDSLLYVRGGRNKRCYTLLSKIFYFLYHKFHCFFAYYLFNKHNIIRNINPYQLCSVVIKDDVRPEHVIRFLEKKASDDVLVILMFHSLKKEVTDQWDYSIEHFEKICKAVSSNHDIDCVTLKELICSIK